MKLVVTNHVVQLDEADFKYYLRGLTVYERVCGYCQVKVVTSKGKYKILSRVLMNCPNDKFVDHLDGDPLNNLRGNLRIVTKQQSSYNRGAFINCKTGVKGVIKVGLRYKATIHTDGIARYLGTFDTIREADTAYKNAAAEYFGSFASHLSRGNQNERI